jgi:hypothetical protein
MAAISALEEDFAGGAVGTAVATTNTIFDNVSGTGASKFVVDPFDSTRRMMEVTSTGAAQSRIHEMDFPATSLLWFRFDMDIDTPLDTNTAILNGYLNNSALAGDKIFDIQIVAGTRTLRLRNVNTTVWTSTVLAAGTKHRVYVYVNLGSATKQIRLMVYSGGDNTVLTQDSGLITSTATPGTISHLRAGQMSGAIGVTRFGRFRADNAVQPLPAATATVSLGPDQTTETGNTCTFPVTTSGTGTLVLTQTAGATVTLTGTGSSRSFVMPGNFVGSIPQPTVVTFQADFGGATDTVTFSAPLWPEWRMMEDGSRKPVREYLYN